MFIDFRERGMGEERERKLGEKEKEKEKEKHRCEGETVISWLPYAPRLGIEPANLSVGPDRESSMQPFGVWSGTPAEVVFSIARQGARPGRRFNPWSGYTQEAAYPCFSLTLMFLPLSFSSPFPTSPPPRL